MNVLKVILSKLVNLSELSWQTIICESEAKFGNGMSTFTLVCVSVKHMIGD